MNYDLKWYQVTPDTWRMETPDGWLVQTDNGESGIALCFVPDKNKEWRSK